MTQAQRTTEQRLSELEDQVAALREEADRYRELFGHLAGSPMVRSALSMLKVDVTAVLRPRPPGGP